MFRRSAPPDWKAQLRCSTALVPLERILVPAMLAGGLLGSVSALANPLGGQVVGGAATISQPSSTQTTINQSSQSTVINWQSFSIPQGSQVDFNQPNASSVALNRDLSNNASQIAGQLNANGQVWIVNPNGVAITPTAQVNVGGLVATTSNISNSNFLAGIYKFDQPGKPGSSVVNQGNITVSQAGLAALVAPSVANSGVIQAKLGKVTLGSGSEYTVDMYGDGMIKFAVSDQTAAAIAGARVSNTGTINAAGGTVTLSVSEAESIVDNSINAGGTITARSVGSQTGSITIDGNGGTTIVSGTLDASGTSAGQSGGTVKVLGGQVGLTSTANIDVSGDAGGGTADIGGDFHGAGPDANATNTVVEQGATIDADALTNGNGGKVAVWSNGYTNFDGSISARGGAQGGNGGYVETSSGGDLGIGAAALVDTSAPKGMSGDWLLDPANVDIETGTDSGADPDTQVDGTSGTTLTFSHDTGTDVTVDTAAIVTGLTHGNVTIQAGNDITDNGVIDATGTAGATGSLEFDAGESILINGGASIKLNGGSFTAVANDSAAYTADPSDRGLENGSFTMASGTSINVAAGSNAGVSISVLGNFVGTVTYNAGSVTLGGITTGTSGTLQVTGSATSIAQTTDGLTVGGASTFSSSMLGATIALSTATTNALTGAVTLSTTGTGADINLSNTLNTTVASASAGGALTIDVGSNTLTLPSISTGGSQSYTAATVNLNGSNYAVTHTGDFSVTGASTLGTGVTVDTSAKNGDVVFANTVDGSQGLTVNAGTGSVTFEDAVGSHFPLTQLSVTGPTTLDKNVTTTGTQTYNSAVIIGGNDTLKTTNNGSIDFISTVDATSTGGQSLTVNAGTGTVTFGAAVGTTALSLLSVTGPTTLDGDVTTTGTQTYNSAITLGAAATLTSTGSGNITFASTVDALTTGGESLTVNTAGTTIFDGPVGATQPLLFVTTDAPGTTDLNGGVVNTTTTQTYNDPVVLSASETLTSTGTGANGNVTFASTVDALTTGGESLTVNAGTGTVTFGAAVGTTALSLLSVTGPTTLDGNVTTTGTQTYNSAESLNTAATVLTTTSSLVTLGPTTVTTPSDTLTISSGTGGATLNGIIAGGLTLPTGTVTLNGGTYSISSPSPYVFPAVTTNGTLTLGQATNFGAVTLGSGTTFDSHLANGAVTFDSTVAGAGDALSVSTGGGNIAFDSTVGSSSASSLGAMTLTTTGTTTVGGAVFAASLDASLASGPIALDANVTTSGLQTYGGAVTLGATPITLTTTSNGAVTFDSTVAGAGDALSVSTGGGNIAFDSTVGSSGASSLGAMTLTTTGTTMLGGAVFAASLDASLATGPIALDANVTTSGLQTYGGPVTLTTNGTTTLDTTNADGSPLGANITFDTINGTTAGGQALTLTAGTGGTVSFEGNVGTTAALGALTLTDAALDISPNVNITTQGGAFSQTGPAVLLGGVATSTTIDTTNAGTATNGANITFYNTIDGTTAGDQALTLKAGALGTIVFEDNVGTTLALGALTLSDRLVQILPNVNITTQGGAFSQTGAMVLLGGVATSTTIATNSGTATTGANITFDGTIDGTTAGDQALTLKAGTGGTVAFEGNVGTTAALGALTLTDAALDISPNANVTTQGGLFSQTGPTVLLGGVATNTTIDTTNGGASLPGANITFDGAVSGTTAGDQALTVKAGGGAVAFDSTVGASHTGIGAFDVTTGGTTTLSGNVWAASLDITGPVSFPNSVSIFTDAADTGAGTDGTMTFGSQITYSVNTNFPLDLNAGTATLTLSGVSMPNTTAFDFTSGALILDGGTYAEGADGTGIAFVNTPTTLNGTLLLGDAFTFGSGSTVTLGSDTTLHGNTSADTITVAGPLNGAHALAVTGAQTTIVNAAVGVTTPLSSINVAGPLALAANITTSGDQTAQGAVTLGTNVTMISTAGNITFASTVDNATATAEGLTVEVGSGKLATFDGLVGGGPNGALASFLSEGFGTPTNGTTDINTTAIATSGDQDYKNAVELSATPTLTASSGNVTFERTVDNATATAEGLTVEVGNGKLATFDGRVGGGGTALASLLSEGFGTATDGTTDLNGGGVDTIGTQTYDNSVTLSAATTALTTAGALVTLGSVSGSGDTLSISSGSGGVTLNGITAAGLTLTASGTVTLNGGTYGISSPTPYVFPAVTTNGNLILGQATSFGAVTLGSGTTFDSHAANGAVTFDSTVAGAGNALTVTTGSGNIAFDGAIGASGSSLGAVTLTTIGTPTLGGAVFAASLDASNATGGITLDSNVTTSGTQTYGGAVTLTGNVTLTSTGAGSNGNIRLGSTVDSGGGAGSPFSLTVNTAGTTIFDGAVGGTTALASVTTDAPGTMDLNGGVVNTTGTQTFNDPVTLSASATLTSTGAGAAGNITFASTIDALTTGGESLTVKTDGTTNLQGSIGSSHPLSNLTTEGDTAGHPENGTTDLNILPGTIQVKTTGAQSYDNAVTLGENTALQSSGGGAITFGVSAGVGGTVDGGFGLTTLTDGTVTFFGQVGNGTPLAGLTTEGVTTAATGTTDLNILPGTIQVKTTGAQSYDNAVTLGENTALQSSGGGAITFGVSAGVGGTVDGGFGLTTLTDGTVTFFGQVGNGTPLAGLTTEGVTAAATGTTDLNILPGTIQVKTTGAQSYDNAVTLGENTALQSSGGGAITFGVSAGVGGTVDGGFGLTTLTDGTVTFFGQVGNGTPLAGLTTEGVTAAAAGTTDLNILPGTIQVKTTGAQSYDNAVTLGENTALQSSGGGAITFGVSAGVGGTVDGGFGLTTLTDGTVTFFGQVGNGTPLAGLTTEGVTAAATGTTDLNILPGTIQVKTTGAQSYDNAVTLSENTALQSSGGGAITFGVSAGVGGTVDGGFGLTTLTDGTVTFFGQVGNGTQLAGLTTEGVTAAATGTTDLNILPGTIQVKTTGAQSYDNAVTLSENTALQSSGGGAITFGVSAGVGGTVDGGFGLTTLTDGTVTFFGQVGNGTQLAGLTTEGVTAAATGTTDLNILPGTIQVKTTGAQSYDNAVTLSENTALQSSGGGAITFGVSAGVGGTVDGGFGLTTLTDGTVTFFGQVGGVGPLASLTTEGASTPAAGVTDLGIAVAGTQITTAGTQNYANSTVLTQNAALASTGGGNVTFGVSTGVGGTINGGFSLNSLTSGTTTLFGQVGTTSPLTSLAVTGSSVLNGNAVTTSTTQSYGGGVMLGTNNDLTGTTVTFDATVDGAKALTVTGNGMLNGAVGGNTALTSLAVTGGSVLNGNAVTTSTTQSYGGGVMLGTNNDLTGTTVTFGATVDGAKALTVTGNGMLNGAVGGNTALTSLAVTGGSVLNGNAVTTSTTQSYGGGVMLGTNNDLTGTTVTFDATVDGAKALTVTGNGMLNGAVGGNTALTSLAVTGSSVLNGNAVTTSTTQSYGGGVMLGTNNDLTGTTVTFGATVDGAKALTVTGNGMLNGAVGGNTALTSLAVTGSSVLNGNAVTTSTTQSYGGGVMLGTNNDLTGTTVTFGATVDGAKALTVTGNGMLNGAVGGNTALTSLAVTGGSVLNGNAVTTSTTQSYGGGVMLGTNNDLTGTTVTFGATVDGAKALTVTGNGMLNGAVGGNTALTSLAVTGGSVLNGNAVTTSTTQSYGGGVMLGTNNDLTGTTVTFGATVDGAKALTVTGNGMLNGAVGGNTALTSLAVTGSSVLNGNAVTTSTTQSYGGGVMLGTNNDLTGTTVTFDATVDGAKALTVTGNGMLNGAVGGNTALTSLAVTGGSVLNGNAVTTSTTQSYGGGVMLGTNNDLTGTTVTFGATVDGAKALTVTGNGMLNGAVGGNTALTSLAVTGGSVLNGNAVTTSTTQSYGGGVMLGTNNDLTGTTVTFDATVDGAKALTVTGNGMLNGAVSIASLDITNASTINTGSVATATDQMYQGSTTINVNTSLTSSANGNIAFGGALTDGSNLSISNGQGSTTFGGTTALQQLTATTSLLTSSPNHLFSLTEAGGASPVGLVVGPVNNLPDATLGGKTGEAAASELDFLPLNATVYIDGFLATNTTKELLGRAELAQLGLNAVLGLISDIEQQIDRGGTGETAAQAAFEQFVYREDYAVDPFALKYNILGLGGSDVPGFNDISYVLDGFWENMLKKDK